MWVFRGEGETLSEPCSLLVVEASIFAADLEQVLTSAGFAVESASSGEEALAIFAAGDRIYRALITDVRLAAA